LGNRLSDCPSEGLGRQIATVTFAAGSASDVTRRLLVPHQRRQLFGVDLPSQRPSNRSSRPLCRRISTGEGGLEDEYAGNGLRWTQATHILRDRLRTKLVQTGGKRMTNNALPRKTREFHNHHFDSTIWNDFEFRDGDIVIGTYAKSGTTWVQQIVSQLLFDGAEELETADEIWLTSSTREIAPVVKINDHVVGNGTAGEYWKKIIAIYQGYKQELRNG